MYIYIYIEIRKNEETILSSLQACFVITHSSEDFIVYRTLVLCIEHCTTEKSKHRLPMYTFIYGQDSYHMDLIYCSTDGSPRTENNPNSIHSFKAICITHQHHTTSRKQYKKEETKIEVKTLQQVSKKIPTS